MTKETEKISLKQTEYWYALDAVKGILIIAVFLGHIIPGVLRETFPRYLIYSFHMPIFIGISGFLLNLDKMDMRVDRLISKYWKRMLGPWIIAVCVFYIVNNLGGDLTVRSFLSAFAYPFYHLWFILGYISYLIILCVLWVMFRKLSNAYGCILIVATIISLASKWELLIGNTLINGILDMVHYNFRLYNFIFFVIGVYFRHVIQRSNQNYILKKIWIYRIATIILVLITVLLFFYGNDNVEKLMYFVLNVPLLITVLDFTISNSSIRCRWLEFLGQYSLPIYLYHVLCKFFAGYFGVEGSPMYYIVTIILFILECIAVYLLRNIPVINRYILGSQSQSLKNDRRTLKN
ncbi:MAG: acyltransferase [Lachnospiraceae bacterium]|nr:acyltransferase [Lachnospiraceae bacterium]